MRILSLFAGIGGLELGLERAGVGRVVCQVEIDPWARGILARHWPDVARHDDIRTFQPTQGCAEIVVGGFPCQDISQAGRGEGIQEGNRSGLWSEFVRVIRLVRPHFVLVENVAILRKRGLDRVLGDLAALGYDAEWDCVPAAAVGAPHLRDRLFILAHRNDCRRLHGQAPVKPADAWLPAQRQPGAGGPDVADPDSQRRHGGRAQSEGGRDEPPNGGPPADANGEQHQGGPHEVGWPAAPELPPNAYGLGWSARQQLLSERQRHATGSGWWATEPGMGRVADGVPGRVDKLRGYGNAVVPQVGEFLGGRVRMIAEGCGNLEVPK